MAKPTNFPSGITSQGMPVPFIKRGTVWYVDSNKGADTNSGRSAAKPFATIDKAIGIATANNDDLIVLLPGHAENMSTAAIFAVDKAGLTIIGLGEGTRIPTFSSTAAAGACMITVANTVLQHIKFVANFATGTTQAIDLTADADGTVIRDCVFRDTSADNEFLKHIDIATTVANVVIEDCDFTSAAGTMSSSVYFTGASDHCTIRNNVWHVDASASVIDHLTGIATMIRVHGNRVVNIDASAGLVLGIKSDSTSTGNIFDNYLLSPATGAAVLAATNDFFVAQNFASNDINTSGVLNPAADAI